MHSSHDASSPPLLSPRTWQRLKASTAFRTAMHPRRHGATISAPSFTFYLPTQVWTSNLPIFLFGKKKWTLLSHLHRFYNSSHGLWNPRYLQSFRNLTWNSSLDGVGHQMSSPKSYPSVADHCWRRQSTCGTPIHILWKCLIIQLLWYSISYIARTHSQLQLDPKVFLFHLSHILMKAYKKNRFCWTLP